MSLPNPLLPGFHPDPSVVRVGDMYYHAWAPTLRHHDGRFHLVDGVETVLAVDWFDDEGTDA